MTTGSVTPKPRRIKRQLFGGRSYSRLGRFVGDWRHTVAGIFRKGVKRLTGWRPSWSSPTKKGGCEERRFDNHSGRIVSSNYVDCEARLADERDSTPSENMRAERMRAILGAFRR
jgi:hypothetical protein